MLLEFTNGTGVWRIADNYLVGETTKWLPCVFSPKESTLQMCQQMDLI
jgi:hypothetical protein